MGRGVGVAVGTGVGVAVGTGVGVQVGTGVGVQVGTGVGVAVGTGVGVQVGTGVGVAVGAGVGVAVGTGVGVQVGTGDGVAVGVQVGTCVGVAVGTSGALVGVAGVGASAEQATRTTMQVSRQAMRRIRLSPLAAKGCPLERPDESLLAKVARPLPEGAPLKRACCIPRARPDPDEPPARLLPRRP